jgi:hypothetical protein
MIRATFVLAVLALGAWSLGSAVAEEKKADKEVKLTGTLMCAKCKLKLDGIKKCVNALQVKEGDKEVNYLLDDKGMEEDYHACGGDVTKDVVVIGKVTEKDGKKWVKPTKVELPKK